MRAPVLACLALAPLLAGCSGPSAAPLPQTGTGSPAVALAAPAWEVGDWWNFTGPFGSFTYAVSGVRGEDYIVDTDEAGLAFYDARFDVSTLGQVRKSDLAGSQHGGRSRVHFFDWPLRDNKTWFMGLDLGQGGDILRVHARQVGPEAFALTAYRLNGTAYVSYTYDNRSRWFTEIDFKEPDGSDSAFKVTLQRSGKAFGGQLVRWTGIKQVLNKSGEIPPQEVGFFPVEPGTTDVYAEVAFSCAQGSATVAVGVANGPHALQGYGLPPATCPAQQFFAGSLGPHAEGDNWGYLLESTGASGTPAPPGTYTIQAWQRALVSFAAGNAPA